MEQASMPLSTKQRRLSSNATHSCRVAPVVPSPGLLASLSYRSDRYLSSHMFTSAPCSPLWLFVKQYLAGTHLGGKGGKDQRLSPLLLIFSALSSCGAPGCLRWCWLMVRAEDECLGFSICRSARHLFIFIDRMEMQKLSFSHLVG